MVDNPTPRERAFNIAIAALYARYNILPSDTKEEKRIQNAIAKLHNELLGRSGMDGIELSIFDLSEV